MQRHVILVDPYSEAAEFANAFRARGVASVAILSTPAPLKSYLHGWKPESFSATHFHDGDFAKLVTRLTKGEPGNPLKGIEETGDYEVDEKKRTVAIHEAGVAKVEDWLGIDNLYESVNTPLVGYLNNAIKAKELFKRDKDYVILDGEVLIVDEHTGRILAGRRYNEGMHQAIEAKEGVEIKAENQTLATVTLQNYFRMYDKLAGMTGTAETEAAEFMSTYKLGVVAIPTQGFHDDPDAGRQLVRWAFCKEPAVIEEGVRRLAAADLQR